MSDHGKSSVDLAAVKKIVTALVVVCIIWVLLDFTYTKHGHYGFEEIPGFHAFYGFVSCVLLVLAATQMRKIVMRDEDYYDEPASTGENEEAQDV